MKVSPMPRASGRVVNDLTMVEVSVDSIQWPTDGRQRPSTDKRAVYKSMVERGFDPIAFGFPVVRALADGTYEGLDCGGRIPAALALGHIELEDSVACVLLESDDPSDWFRTYVNLDAVDRQGGNRTLVFRVGAGDDKEANNIARAVKSAGRTLDEKLPAQALAQVLRAGGNGARGQKHLTLVLRTLTKAWWVEYGDSAFQARWMKAVSRIIRERKIDQIDEPLVRALAGHKPQTPGAKDSREARLYEELAEWYADELLA